MSVDLKGRVAIVTGSSQNLGKVMAQGLAKAGARVVLASPDIERLNLVAAEIGRGDAIAVQADITIEADCRRVLDEADKAFGGADILVNNARNLRSGIADYDNAPFWEKPVAFWDAAVRVNVFGTYLMSRTFAPHMMARGWGRIINISTGLRTMLSRHNSPYGVTKAAIDMETIIWAQDLAGTGVTVNTLLPGGACDTERPRSGPPSKGVLLPMEILVPPLVWLASNLSDRQTGGRYVATYWDPGLSPEQAAKGAIRPPIFREPGDD